MLLYARGSTPKRRQYSQPRRASSPNLPKKEVGSAGGLQTRKPRHKRGTTPHTPKEMPANQKSATLTRRASRVGCHQRWTGGAGSSGGGCRARSARLTSSAGWSAIVVVTVMVKGFSVYKDVVPPGRGNVPYLPEVMIAVTAVSRQVCRDAEEGAVEEGRTEFDGGRHSPRDDRAGKERSKNALARSRNRTAERVREQKRGDSKEDGRVPSRIREGKSEAKTDLLVVTTGTEKVIKKREGKT